MRIKTQHTQSKVESFRRFARRTLNGKTIKRVYIGDGATIVLELSDDTEVTIIPDATAFGNLWTVRTLS